MKVRGKVYVDDLREYPVGMIAAEAIRHGLLWSHLWVDPGNEETLHAFAKKMGLKREWFQDRPKFPHYDIVPSRRKVALKLGAVEMSLYEWCAKQNNKRRGNFTSKDNRALEQKGVGRRSRS